MLQTEKELLRRDIKDGAANMLAFVCGALWCGYFGAMALMRFAPHIDAWVRALNDKGRSA
jgi:hypothetical protein